MALERCGCFLPHNNGEKNQLQHRLVDTYGNVVVYVPHYEGPVPYRDITPGVPYYYTDAKAIAFTLRDATFVHVILVNVTRLADDL